MVGPAMPSIADTSAWPIIGELEQMLRLAVDVGAQVEH